MTHEHVNINVLLFAGAAEAAGVRALSLTVSMGTTLESVIETLVSQHAGLARLAMHSRWAVDSGFVTSDFTFTQTSCELAMIPPVSGG